MAKNEFYCPKCKACLNIKESIVFAAKSKSGMGLLYFHPELGNYGVTKHPSFTYEMGEKVKFFCPVCNAALSFKGNDNHANVLMIDANKKEFNVIFSQVAGEQSTYKICGETMECYGKDAKSDLDFNSLSQLI